MKYIPPVILMIAGCGSTTDRQAHQTQVETLVIPALTVSSPAGDFTSAPITIHRKVETVSEETEKKTIDLPDAGSVIGPLVAGSPWGGIISGVIGLGTAAFAAKKALDNGRQRDNLIDATEAAKDEMDPETWKKVRKTMNNVQHDDTIAAVKKRTA